MLKVLRCLAISETRVKPDSRPIFQANDETKLFVPIGQIPPLEFGALPACSGIWRPFGRLSTNGVSVRPIRPPATRLALSKATIDFMTEISFALCRARRLSCSLTLRSAAFSIKSLTSIGRLLRIRYMGERNEVPKIVNIHIVSKAKTALSVYVQPLQ